MVEEPQERAPFPFDNSNFINDLYFTWIFPLTRFFRTIPPTEFNMYEMPQRMEYKTDLKNIRKEWNRVKKLPNPNIFSAIWTVLKTQIVKAFLPGVIGYNCNLINAVMLLYILGYLNGTVSNVVPYIIIYAFSVHCSSITMNYSLRATFLLVGKLKAILTELIFDKALKTYYGEVSQGNQSGKITSLISADLEFLEATGTMAFIFSLPLFLIGCGVLLWFNLGVAGIVGLIVTILHLPVILYCGKAFGKIRFLTAGIGDSRMKMISNLIEGIRIVKLYGWEHPYLEKLFEKRKKEIFQHKRKGLVSCAAKAINYGSMGLVLFVTFSVHVALGNKLEPAKAFSSITVLIISTWVISLIGTMAATQIFLIVTSMRRITDALLIKDKKNVNSEKTDNKYSIIAKNCEFMWKEPKKLNENEEVELTRRPTENGFTLSGINFKAVKGELIIVIGAVGSGKTALFLSLLREIYLKFGDLRVNGEISFASEEPWIVSGTIKENILMGSSEDTEFYYEVIEKCCLEKDLELFKEYGDETMVGDRGITLSGGQKARVSLARAVYKNRVIVLLDDPLSAVDPEVCFKLFNSCIKGILKEKTVLLATHQAHFVSQADKILILDEGKQIFFGTYQQLIDQNLIDYLGKIQQVKEEDKKSDPLASPEKKIERQPTIKDRKSILAEESAQGNVPIRVYYRFFMLGFKSPLFLILVILVHIVGQVAYLAVIYWVVYWSAASDQEDSHYYYGMAIIVAALYILSYFRVLIINFPMLNATKQLHNFAINGLAFTRSLFFDQNPTGRMLNRFAKDTSQIDEVLIQQIIESVFTFTLILGNFIIVLIIIPYIVIPFIGIIVYFVLLVRYFNPVSRSLKRMEQVTKSPILSLLNSSLHGLATIRCLGLEKMLKKEMRANVELNYKVYSGFQLMFRTVQQYLEFGPMLLGLINIIVIVNIKDSMKPGLAAMSISMTLTIMGYVGFLFRTLIETDNYMTSSQRLFEYSDLLSEGEQTLNTDFKITKGQIEIREIYMRYRENYDFALKNLSFTVQAGMKTGIIGRTGAGKSSIMQVLFRLTNPEQGTIFIDGQDYLKAGLHDLRKQMSVIPQSATLFIASLRDNLDPFHEHSDADIIKVLKKVRLVVLLEQLPNGLDSEINSEGLSLSAGQKQLVCLARAILRQNKIVMIDEATANVDSETDEFIQKQLNRRFKGSSLLIIAHRLRTVVDSDWIVVMEAGASSEEGTPKRLAMNKDSLFYKMIQHTGPEESEFLLAKLRE